MKYKRQEIGSSINAVMYKSLMFYSGSRCVMLYDNETITAKIGGAVSV